MPDTMPQGTAPEVKTAPQSRFVAEQLYECPFCAGKTELTQQWYPVSGVMYYALCISCWARGPMSARREDAVEFWNCAKRL